MLFNMFNGIVADSEGHDLCPESGKGTCSELVN